MLSGVGLRMEVFDRLVEFFKSRYPSIHEPLTPATNLVSLYRLDAREWALLADKISREPWMNDIHSRLQPSQMHRASTLAQLITLVIDSIGSKTVQLASLRSSLRVPISRSTLFISQLTPRPVRRSRSKRVR